MAKKKREPIREIRNFKELLEIYKGYGENTVFKYKKKGEIQSISYNQFVEDIKALGTALLDLGVTKVAVIGNNRYEWCTTYLAVTTAGLVVVPLDKALTDKEIERLVKRSGAEAIVYDSKYQNAVDEVEKDSNLKYKICMDNTEKEGVLKYEEILKKGKELRKKNSKEYDTVKIDPKKMSVMLFTSGTTNEPKAVMLSQSNLCSQMNNIPKSVKLYETDTLLSFLPIHHTFECTITFLYGTYSGCTIAFCEGLKYIAQNLKDYKVTVFVAVPLVLETMYKKIQKGIEESGKKGLIDAMGKVSSALLKCHIDLRKVLFKPVLKQFDEHLRVVLYGAAPMDKKTILGYNSLGIELVQGYGLTESSPVISAETDERKRPGSVGLPINGVKVKIDNPDQEGIGEILAKGPNIMLGYYENEEATRKALDKDGWLHTGDYGYIDEEGFIYITGRKSDLIVLRNGKNVYPQEIEFLINKLAYVDESLVYSRDKSKTDTLLGAKIVYNKDIIKEKFGDKTEKEYQDLIWKDIKEINEELPTYKHIKEITITDEPLEKTTTQKVKRFVEIQKIETSN